MKGILQLALLALVHCSASMHTVHVFSNEDSYCPYHECVLFNHLLHNASYFFASECTIELLPGNYAVESMTHVVVRDVTNLSWIGTAGSHDVTFHSMISVQCNGNASFIFINSTNLYISGIKFIQCGLSIPGNIAHEAVTIQSHSFYRMPSGAKAAFVFINVQSLTAERINVTQSLGYGLFALNLLGNSSILNSFFYFNGPPEVCHGTLQDLYLCNSAHFYATPVSDFFDDELGFCNGGNALFLFQDTWISECTTKHASLSISESGFLSGIGNNFLKNKGHCNEYECKIPDSSGLGIISGQTTYAISVSVNSVTFDGNHACSGANMFILVHTAAYIVTKITGSHFKNANKLFSSNLQSVTVDGGVLYVSGYTEIPSAYTQSCNNTDYNLSTTLSLQNCSFTNNTARTGAALSINIPHGVTTQKNDMDIVNCSFYGNRGISGSALYIDVETYKLEGYRSTNWAGSIYMYGLKLYSNENTGSDDLGGSLTILLGEGSSKVLKKISIVNSIFVGNEGNGRAKALLIFNTNAESTLLLTIIVSSTTFIHNKPLRIAYHGLKQSGITYFHEVHNITVSDCMFGYNQGSAITSIGSLIHFNGNTDFIGNHGEYGGALALYSYYKYNEESSILANPTVLFFHHHTHLNLVNNSVTKRGGAIFVEDLPIYAEYIHYPCFYQAVRWNHCPGDLSGVDINIRLENNSAEIAGHSIYGGMERDCFFSQYFALKNISLMSTSHYAFECDAFNRLFEILPKPWSQSELSSTPQTLCICHNGTLTELNCQGVSIRRQVYPGQTFNISAVAMGDLGNFNNRYSAAPATIHVEIASNHNAKLGVRQNVQKLDSTCSELVLTISTNEAYIEVLLNAELPTETQYRLQGLHTTFNVVPVEVTLLPCPPGFDLKSSNPTCDCIERILDANCTCSIDKQNIECPVGTWIGRHSNNSVITHNHCPFDYCSLESVTFDLEHQDDQCAFRRSGVLCGTCQQGLSVTLGVSHCQKCSNVFLFLIIPLILAGVLLVILLQLCNFTVSIGSANGIIYFANIVRINHSIFFPSGKSTFLASFTAWLNLDLGIQVCFYSGMDMYAKTWLQFVFPVFIWILVGTIIKISYHSVLMSKLVGSNAVPVLATLFLFSYAKLLRTIITVLSFTHLTYPDGTISAVWLYDGNVPFLKGKHAALFVMALVFALGFVLPYTLLLLLSPCLQTKSAHHGLHWVNKLKPFLDAYHGPYKDRFRNWTGIMLVVRAAQFTIFAFNVQGDPSVNLLVIVIFTCVHIISCWNLGTVYKNQFMNILESYFLLSLGVLAGASLYARTGDAMISKQEAITKSIVGTTFAVFNLILVFHILKRTKPYWNTFGKLLNRKDKIINPEQVEYEGIPNDNINDRQYAHAPTVSYWELREPLNLLENNL